MSYNEFQLTEAEVDRIKAKNAKKAIRAYIKQHGTEPSDISSYYTVSNTELEHYRRIIYAEQMTSEDSEQATGYNVMDYLFSDGSISPTLDSNKTPVAICVIPTSHMADGKARFMSLKEMTTASTQGTVTHQGIKWQNDQTYVDIPGLTNYDKVATINSDGSFKDLQESAFLPVDSKGGFTTVYNGDNYSDEVEDGRYAPSPFLSDGITKNEVYFTEGQALCDIDGNANTTLILNADANKYLAAKACRSFAPGTHDGEWYLPAMGELGYAFVQWKAIDDAIIAANASKSGCGVQLGGSGSYWSSTEHSSSSARRLFTGVCVVYNDTKSTKDYVRAFLAI